MTKPLSIISFGGGVQSTALCVLATQGEIDATHALYANVGDDSENPATIRYVRDVMTPWAKARGLEVVEVAKFNTRRQYVETLHNRMVREGSRSLPIPVRSGDRGMPGKRTCTTSFKVEPIGRWLKAHGASLENPAMVAIGISWDEIERLRNRQLNGYEATVYPLIARRLTRTDCKRIIERAGLPVPERSACYFCPFHVPSAWQKMRREQPALFWKAADLEALINQRRADDGKPPVYLTQRGQPLPAAIPEDLQAGLDFGTGPGETCDEGYCWT